MALSFFLFPSKQTPHLPTQQPEGEAYTGGPRPTVPFEGRAQPYYREEYVGGTPCDLTGAARTAEVLYVCDPGSVLFIMAVSEVATCAYRVIAGSSLLCPDASTGGGVHVCLCVGCFF